MLSPPGRRRAATLKRFAVSGAERLLFTSGQIPQTPTGNVPNGAFDLAQHICATWRSSVTVASFVKITTFLNFRELATVNREIRQEVLGAHSPALTVIMTGLFDEDWLLEIEAVAAGYRRPTAVTNLRAP
jgi:2-iminobutanoate/2-iminopropanoate deaminase